MELSNRDRKIEIRVGIELFREQLPLRRSQRLRRAGNVYQKPKGGTGYGEPIGVNINDLKSTAIQVGVGVGIGYLLYETIKWGGAILLVPETGGTSLVGAAALP